MQALPYAMSYAWNRLSGGLAQSRALNQAYSHRHWDRFDTLLRNPGLPRPIAQLWTNMRADYFQTLGDAPAAWKATVDVLTARRHFLSYMAHQNYLSALIADGDLARFKAAFPRQHREFGTGLPLNLVPSIGALFHRTGDHVGWLKFAAAMRATVPRGSRALFDLKAFAYRHLAREAVGNTPGTSIPAGLHQWMVQHFQPHSPAAEVLAAHDACWEAIRGTSPTLLLEVRYRPQEVLALRNRVLAALQQREPLMFLRLGDGEAYAFSNAATDELPNFREDLELLWWGKVLPPSLRAQIAEDVQAATGAADIIGLPSTPRLAQVLHAFEPAPLSPASRKQLGLFQGVEAAVRSGKVGASWWVDEYANYAFVDPDALKELMAAATRTILIGCFEIPAGHFLDRPDVKVVPIPPVQKVSRAQGVVSSERVLPEVLAEVEGQLIPLLQPGALCLLAAGIAGKPLLHIAKSQGAVALDFGSGLDHVLGHRTRSPELHHLFGPPQHLAPTE